MSGPRIVLGVALAAALVLPGGVAAAQAPAASAPLHPTGALAPRGHLAPRLLRSLRADTPAAIDLSQWAVPVGNQGSVGSCVTWAVNYAMAGWYSRYQHLSLPGIRFAPMYVYSQIHLDDSAGGGGSFPEDAFRIGQDQGIDTQLDYVQGDVDYSHKPTANEMTHAAQFKTGGHTDLYEGAPGPGGRVALQSALAAHQPVALMLPVYRAFDELNATDHRLATDEVDPSTFRGTHEVLVLGYDTRGVRIQNSWGTGWGDHGYADLDWDFVEKYTEQASVMTGLLPGTPKTPGAAQDVSVHQDDALGQARLSWQPPASGSPRPTGYQVTITGTEDGPRSTQVLPATATSHVFQGLLAGVHYQLSVVAVDTAGPGPVRTGDALLHGAPQAPYVLPASPGAAGGPLTASALWQRPYIDGGAPLTGFVVRAYRQNSNQVVTSPLLNPTLERYSMTLPNPGPWSFTVVACNRYGASQPSEHSHQVLAQ